MVDFSKAFDSISKKKLFAMLDRRVDKIQDQEKKAQAEWMNTYIKKLCYENIVVLEDGTEVIIRKGVF